MSSNYVSNKCLMLKVTFRFLIIATKSCEDEPKHETTSAHFHFPAAVLFCGGVQKAVKKNWPFANQNDSLYVFKVGTSRMYLWYKRSAPSAHWCCRTYCMISGAGNKKLLRIKTIISGWFKQEIEENTSADFSLSNTKSTRCFCCCNWHKREKLFDLLV